MAMARLRLYKNPYMYPEYGSITAYGSEMECVPVGVGLRTGTLHVRGNLSDFMNCNYLRITRDGKTIYAWIEDVTVRTDQSMEVNYRVDAWRTYRNNVTLGNQYIVRSPQVTYKKDDLLGSSQGYADVSTKNHSFPNADQNVLVVQVRPGTGEAKSNTPVQPTPYQFYVTPYSTNDWKSNSAILNLINALSGGAETENIVTMYSIPYMNTSGLPPVSLPVKRGGETTNIDGFYLIGTDVNNVHQRLTREREILFPEDVNLNELCRVEHTIQIVIPSAGIIRLPIEIAQKFDLTLRQDIDIFSGASNFMVMSGDSSYYDLSVRGSSTATIPILSDPMDTYVSQNQNALTTALIGDVASIGVGTFMALRGGGLGLLAGGGSAAASFQSVASTLASVFDSSSRYSNPPAYLGTATAAHFGDRFWVVVSRNPVDNASLVHNSYGYPLGKVAPLKFPTRGFIQTRGCAVTTDGTVPSWAIQEINQMFDNGVHVN